MNKFQYQADIEGLAGEPDLVWLTEEGHDGGSPLGLHDVTLFDQDESRLGGDVYDLATGDLIDNSTSDNTGELTIFFDDSEELDDDIDIEWYVTIRAPKLAQARKLANGLLDL